MKYIDGGVTAPCGFSANGVLSGIKAGRTKPDTALIYSEKPCVAAAVFTQNKVKAECVKLSKKSKIRLLFPISCANIRNWHILVPSEKWWNQSPKGGERIMNKYELIYIIDTAVEEAARKELIEKFNGIVTANGGEIVKVEEWGKRRLAYAINYKTEGYYVLMYVKAPAELPKELERNFQINDKILRSLVIRYEGEVPAKREPLKPYAAREAAAPAAEVAAPVANEIVDDEKPESEAE